MDKRSHKKNSKRSLPNTPRVSDKIMEYYHKFGQDRDLEKFMRLYSPASSQDDQKTCADIEKDTCCEAISSSTSSCEALAKMPSRPLSVCCSANSKSLPNIDAQGQDMAIKDVIVAINIEMEGDKEKILSISSENIQTPRKVLKDTRTQTPESIAKLHRRLEWDSLGDVGYKKSMSTSNISILERSLLKDFFRENSVTSEPCTSQQAKQQELQQKHENNILKSIKNSEREHSTPPLACSTLVEGYKEKDTKREAKPKMISQSTSSTSLQEKFEKYAQTSLQKNANVQSREIQCTISSSNSVIEGTATPSSFEYLSSRSSKSSEYILENNSRKHIAPTEHPFITSINDLLNKRKVLCETNQQKHKQLKNIRELQTKFQAALEENKENQSHSTTAASTATSTSSSFSLTKQAPELDLGIQLICSLIDAKSVNGRQKKQLIRDIVKRITRLEADETSQSTNSTEAQIHSNDSSSKRQNIYDSVHSNSSNRPNRNALSLAALPENKPLGVLCDMLANTELGISKAINTQVPVGKPSTSTSNTSEENTSGRKVIKSQKEDIKLKHSQDKHLPKFQVQQATGNDKHFPCKTFQFENVLKENNRKVSNVTPNTSSKYQTNDVINKRQINAGNATVEKPTEIPTKEATSRSTQTTKISTTTRSDSSKPRTSTKSSTVSCSSASTQSLTTQKCIIANKDLNNSNTDAEQPTMSEWLNPLTQSEIEYEERKREEEKKNDAQQTELKRDKHLKKSSKHDCGRVKQLNWIENEIQRLECLKHLLNKDEHNTNTISSTTVSSTGWAAHKVNITKESTQTADKLYDTVYSDKSSVLSESAERLVKEIEIILEESNEDVINLKNNLKRTKERKKEIQIVYEKPKENAQQQQQHLNKIKPKFRTIKDTITINEEQLLTDKESQTETEKQQSRPQREKIDTPSTESSPGSESLRDLVKQRKREFIKAYRTKKQNHYDALKQLQKEEFEYLNLQRSKANTLQKPVPVETYHYSIPHTTMPRKYVTNGYTQQPLPSSPGDEEIKTKTSTSSKEDFLTSNSKHVGYSAAASLQKKCNVQSFKAKDITTPAAAAATTTTTTTAASTTTTISSSSTTSMFCISSDVSIPMGSQMTSSTSTTTHQYDDVAAAVAGVAVQTSDSILRSKPIYGPQILHRHSKRLPTSSTACIQVKPKGIAYVIEFDDNTNSDDIISNTNIKLIESTSTVTTYPSNNIKSLLPSEPQLTLQDHLEKAKPKFLQHSKERKAILNQLQSMRQERDRKLREIIDNSSFNSLERRLQYLPPPPIQKVRISNTKEMKALTNKRFANLPEVVARKEQELEEKKRRSNRILRDVFNRRLQKRVRNGKLSLNHSKTVI